MELEDEPVPEFDFSGAVVAQGQPHSLGREQPCPVAREPLRLGAARLQWMARSPSVPRPCPHALHSACSSRLQSRWLPSELVRPVRRKTSLHMQGQACPLDDLTHRGYTPDGLHSQGLAR